MKIFFIVKVTVFVNHLLCLATGLHEFKAGVVMVEKSVLPFKQEMVGPAIDLAIEVSASSCWTCR